MKGNMRFCVPCLFGVEGLVAQELRDMGLEQVQAALGSGCSCCWGSSPPAPLRSCSRG